MENKTKKNNESIYLDKFFWLNGYWWERNWDRQGMSIIESLRKVTPEKVPSEYYEYYEILQN